MSDDRTLAAVRGSCQAHEPCRYPECRCVSPIIARASLAAADAHDAAGSRGRIILTCEYGNHLRLIDAAKRLRAAGLPLREAHATILTLAAHRRAECTLPAEAVTDALVHDLAALGIETRVVGT